MPLNSRFGDKFVCCDLLLFKSTMTWIDFSMPSKRRKIVLVPVG